MKYELNEQDIKIIQELMDLGLKAGGLKNKPAIDRLEQVLSKPIKDDKDAGETNNT